MLNNKESEKRYFSVRHIFSVYFSVIEM